MKDALRQKAISKVQEIWQKVGQDLDIGAADLDSPEIKYAVAEGWLLKVEGRRLTYYQVSKKGLDIL